MVLSRILSEVFRKLSAKADLMDQTVIAAPLTLVSKKIGDYDDLLARSEAEAIVNAVPERKREFSTGRYAAKIALGSMGLDTGQLAIERRRNRDPLWPEGIVGSISHSSEYALAIVSQDTSIQGLGIDLEQRGRVKNDVAGLVLTHSEIEKISGEPEKNDVLTFLFSAKEAVFKAVFPTIGKMIGYDECEISWSEESNSFLARYCGAELENELMNIGYGNYVRFAGHVITGFLVPTQDSSSRAR